MHREKRLRLDAVSSPLVVSDEAKAKAVVSRLNYISCKISICRDVNFLAEIILCRQAGSHRCCDNVLGCLASVWSC